LQQAFIKFNDLIERVKLELIVDDGVTGSRIGIMLNVIKNGLLAEINENTEFEKKYKKHKKLFKNE
jgi:hypothetical protein